jgi:predicted nuclease of predicted toxin-antitoxin system
MHRIKKYGIAKLNDFIIVTQDVDFDDLNSLYGFPPKIIWIRTGNLKTHAIADILNDYSDEINRFVENPDFGCFEIFKFKRTRLKHLPA